MVVKCFLSVALRTNIHALDITFLRVVVSKEQALNGQFKVKEEHSYDDLVRLADLVVTLNGMVGDFSR